MANGRWRTPVEADGAGFPDLVLLRRDRLLVAELKVGQGKLSREQSSWINGFRAAGILACVWRPDNWDEIEETLR